MRRLLDISRYHWCFVFVIAGMFTILFAFSTYNLFQYTMANLSFLQEYGIVAIQEGALSQSLEVIIGGTFSMICFLGFKVCEGELVMRFRRWSHSSD